MKKEHPNIIMHFVPAGCTGVFQPCDVGIQQIMKHSLKWSCHCDIVGEVLAQVDNGWSDITVSKAIGVLHDCTVSWLWDAYMTLNKPHIVKKVSCVFPRCTCMTHQLQAFQMCKTGEFNLSYKSLTSFNAREKLRNLKKADPIFWAELTAGCTAWPTIVGKVAEDDMDAELVDKDDSDLPCDVVVASAVLGEIPTGVRGEKGWLVSTAVTELLDYVEAETEERPDWASGEVNSAEGSRAVGKRRVTANKLYTGDLFWRH